MKELVVKYGNATLIIECPNCAFLYVKSDTMDSIVGILDSQGVESDSLIICRNEFDVLSLEGKDIIGTPVLVHNVEDYYNSKVEDILSKISMNNPVLVGLFAGSVVFQKYTIEGSTITIKRELEDVKRGRL